MSKDKVTEFDRGLANELGVSPETVCRARTGAGFRHRPAVVPPALPVRLPPALPPPPRVALREVVVPEPMPVPRLSEAERSPPRPPRVALRGVPRAEPMPVPRVRERAPSRTASSGVVLRAVETSSRLVSGPGGAADGEGGGAEGSPARAVPAGAGGPSREGSGEEPVQRDVPVWAADTERLWLDAGTKARDAGDVEAQRFFALAAVVERVHWWRQLQEWLGAEGDEAVLGEAVDAVLEDERARRAAALLARPTFEPFDALVPRMNVFVEEGVEERRRAVVAGVSYLQHKVGLRAGVAQEEYDRVAGELAAAKGDYTQRLAVLFLGGYYPWFRALVRWAEARELTVLYPGPGVDFSIRAKGERASFLEQVLFMVVAPVAARRKAWLVRQSEGEAVGERPSGTVGIAVLHCVDFAGGEGALAVRPTAFVPGLVDLEPLAGRLEELREASRADELVAFAPVPEAVARTAGPMPSHLRLVPVSYAPDAVKGVVAAAADVLGVLALE